MLLRDIYATLKAEQMQAAAGGGEIASWSVNQGEY